MSNIIEVTHTLRLYDPDFIAKLSMLLESKAKHYQNKNEFMTEIMKLGYERYITAGKNAKDPTEAIKELHSLLEEQSLYIKTQFRHMHIGQALLRQIISSVYNMTLSLIDGKAVPPEKVEDGFFDDLPARFEKVIIKLEQQYGLKT